MDITKTFFENIPVRENIHYYRQDTLIAMRHNEWKMYIRDPNPWNDEITQDDIPVLYNIEHDPYEKYDVASDHLDIVKKINQLSNEHIQSARKVPSQLNDILPNYKAAYDLYNKK